MPPIMFTMTRKKLSTSLEKNRSAGSNGFFQIPDWILMVNPFPVSQTSIVAGFPAPKRNLYDYGLFRSSSGSVVDSGTSFVESSNCGHGYPGLPQLRNCGHFYCDPENGSAWGCHKPWNLTRHRIAYLLTGSLSIGPMWIGACLAGGMRISHRMVANPNPSREDAAMGLTFTSFLPSVSCCSATR